MRSRSLACWSRVGLGVLLACALLPLTPGPATGLPGRDPGVFRVDAATGDDVTGTGTLANPYATIEKAMTVATVYGDVVRVAAGAYYPPSTITIPVGVRLIGAGLGRTVVWGVGGMTGPVFDILYGDMNTRLEGFEIRGGGGSHGGAVRIQGGSAPGWGPVVTRNDFVDNGTTVSGGAMYIADAGSDYCKPMVSYCTFQGNACGTSGGAIYAGTGADPNIYRCTFDGNHASGSGVYGGGGIYVEDANARIERCYFAGNTALGGSGGAIGINGPDGLVDIWETRVYANDADFGAGIFVYEAGYPTDVRNCRVENNASDSHGGGMRIYNAGVGIEGTSFVGNRANGGATSGAISVYDLGADQPVDVDSSIFHNNGGDDVPPPSATCDLSITYSCLNESFAGTGNIQSADPRFTRVSPVIERLAADSPCIDTGNPASTLAFDFENLARPKDGPDSNTTARTDMGHFEYGTTIGRLAGSDRFATSAAAVQDRCTESPVAIIATGRGFPDALCASGLAGAFHAPVLLCDTNSLPSSVRLTLQDMDAREAIIVGGVSVVGSGVQTALEDLGIDVKRIAGADRYATSAAVAAYMADMSPVLGTDFTRFCWVARGDMFPDALSLAPLAALNGAPGPVLLTQTNSLPSPVRAVLRDNGYEHALVAGGTGAVSTVVYDAIGAEIQGNDIERAAGTDRYATSAAIAEWAMGADFTAGEFIGLAIGDNFPDALAGGAACGYEQGVLLLTEKDRLHPKAATFMSDHTDSLREIYVFGGTAVVSDDVLDDCEAIAP